MDVYVTENRGPNSGLSAHFVVYFTFEVVPDPTPTPTPKPKATPTPVISNKTQHEEMVWIQPNGGTKYHKISTCSHMPNAIKITLEDAKCKGFTPCGKCY